MPLADVVTSYLQERPDADTLQQVHRVVAAVVELGGAVGWLEVPSTDEVEQWLVGWHELASTCRGRLLLVRVDGRVEALGGWRAGPPGPVGHVFELVKIMAHPAARGHGLGRVVVTALADDAKGHGAEVLVLGARGNNQGAVALYESCGFAVWGVLPNAVAVGDQRWDDIRMYRQVALPASAVLNGTAPGGLGGSLRR